MNANLPHLPFDDNIKSNITYGELQSLSFDALSDWIDLLRKELKDKWDNGIPPYKGISADIIKDRFSKLRDFKTGINYYKDDNYSDYKGFIKNFSKIANGVNQFFPTMLSSRINGKSIYDYLSRDELATEFKHTIVHKVRFDKMYLFSKYIISKGKDDYQQFIDWVSAGSDDRKFWIENYNFNRLNDKNNNLRITPTQAETLRSKGIISNENEHNWVGFDTDDKDNGYVVRYYDKTLKIFPKIFQILRIGLNQVAVNFPPLTARWIYENYLGLDGNREEYKIYDSSAGWGGRMLGALCSKKKIHYVATDVNKSNVGCYESLGSFYNKQANGKNTFDIYYDGSEVIHHNKKFMKYKDDIDLVFTSPPYFNKELYSTDEEQSCIKYQDYQTWLKKFLLPTFETYYKVLRTNKYCVINISDIKNKKKEYPLEQDTIRIAERVGFHYEGKIGMCMTRMVGLSPTQSKNYWMDIKNQSTWKVEPILIFKKENQMLAKQNHYKDILKLFRNHRNIFPHLRPKDLEKAIENNQMVWSDNVAIQFKIYQRRHKIGDFTCNVGDIHLMKMVSSKGQANTIMKRWIYSYGTGRVILSVRRDNHRAVELYKSMNFEIVGERCWGKQKVKGLVMKFDF